MPLRLKSLELQGYKTFATRSVFEFPGMITAIVGPNGSGKSNITDGLRWVLGEQSFGLLRGKKTEDMIFSGSEGKPRAGMATATIHFDNTTGWLPLDYAEVTITRRAYRDGQNEYLLNGQRVRLRDISEMLSQSGLSERTYTVVGQGLVDASLALRPEERRKLFEEAAGIGLYRSRREETLNRLESTHKNVERVQVILAELEPRLTMLERQARKAQEYDRVRSELRLVLREWYGYHWYKSQQDLVFQQEKVRQQERNVEIAREKHDELNTEILEVRQKAQELRAQINQWHASASALHTEKELVSREIAVIEERSRSLTDQISTLQIENVQLVQEVESTQENISELENERLTIQQDMEKGLQQSLEIKTQLDQQLELKNRKETAIADCNRKISQVESQMSRNKLLVEERTQRQRTILGNREKFQQSIDETGVLIVDLENEIEQIHRGKDQFETKVKQTNEQIDTTQKENSKIISHLSELRSQKARIQGEFSKTKIEADVIREAERNLNGYSEGARHLLMRIRRGDIKGVGKALSSDLLIPEQYETAITIALGDYLDAIIIQDEAGLETALRSLEDLNEARSTILSVPQITPEEKVSVIQHPDCLGNAMDLIQYPVEMQNFLTLALGRTLIATNRKNIREMMMLLPPSSRIVTLEGEIFYKNGTVMGGKQITSSRISRPRKILDFEKQLQQLQTELDACDEQINRAEQSRKETEEHLTGLKTSLVEYQGQLRQYQTHLQQTSLEADKSRRQVEWNHTQLVQLETEKKQIENELSEAGAKIETLAGELQGLTDDLGQLIQENQFSDMDNLRAEFNFQQTNLAVNQRALDDIARRLAEKYSFLKNSLERTESNKTRTRQVAQDLSSLETGRKEKKEQEEDKSNRLRRLQEEIDPAEEELNRLDAEFNRLQETETLVQNTLTSAEKNLTQAQMDLNHKRENLEVLRKRIEEDFGLVAFEYSENQTGPTPLPMDGMVEKLPRVEELSPELEGSINNYKGMLRRMGAVNPEARAEYTSTKERFDFLQNQIADLNKAEEDLKKILADLDQLMKVEFHRTFEKVAEQFPRMFNRLFGGGNARLMMTDPENVLETGIEIQARLPGKREQELTLLSGGERSLTAVALIFALLKISPTPFCVLDEVDAALDETNVGRFRDLLVELSQDTQFIIVTHNRNTVQAANVIYGITMGRDSTSQAISLRLDEVSDDMLKK